MVGWRVGVRVREAGMGADGERGCGALPDVESVVGGVQVELALLPRHEGVGARDHLHVVCDVGVAVAHPTPNLPLAYP